jgi:hypothetical protein
MMRWLLFLLIFVFSLSFASLTWVPSRTPQSRIAAPENQLTANQCLDCHSDIVTSFQQAPHAFTLRPGNNPEVQTKWVGRQLTLRGSTYRFERIEDRLYLTCDRFPGRYPVDWVFGSGHHALTPISLVENGEGETELIQLDVSWFAGDILSLTPGHHERDEKLPSIGLHHTAAQTQNCFGCHSTSLVVEAGKFAWDKFHAGISCARCHPGSAVHLASGGETATELPWKQLSSRESIDRCGECHRRADEFTADEIKPDAVHLVRFAPVGLVQSACFQASQTPSAAEDQDRSQRFDCMTCHDPHQPAAPEPGYYTKRCVSCHDGQSPTHPPCPTQPPAANCLSCHMPKVPTSDHLRFTDHWIRIRANEVRP